MTNFGVRPSFSSYPVLTTLNTSNFMFLSQFPPTSEQRTVEASLKHTIGQRQGADDLASEKGQDLYHSYKI
jgi:hypothetical protein